MAVAAPAPPAGYSYVTYTVSDSSRFATYIMVYDAIETGKAARYEAAAGFLYYPSYSDEIPFPQRKRIYEVADLQIIDLDQRQND